MPPKRTAPSDEVLKRLEQLESALFQLQEQVTKLQAWKAKLKEKKRDKKSEKQAEKDTPKANSACEKSQKRQRSCTASAPPPAKRGRPPTKNLALPPTPAPEKPESPRRDVGKSAAVKKDEAVPVTTLSLAQKKPGRGRKVQPATANGTANGKSTDPGPSAKQQEEVKRSTNTAPSGGAEVKTQTKITDPRAQLACYEMLKVSRSATPDQVKRAFRSLAVVMHPDKGGDHKDFCCLQEAFETLQDQAERAAYDRQLVSNGSRDGLNTSNSAASGISAVEMPAKASPVMLRDAFLGIQRDGWPELLEVLTDTNLQELNAFLELSVKEQNQVAKQTASCVPGRSVTNTPGICKAGQQYYAKAAFEGVSMLSRTTADLTVAIEARIALLSLRASAKERIEQGQDFASALRSAVAFGRSVDQNAIFAMKFTFDFRFGGKHGVRVMTPNVPDVETLIEDRQVLLDLQAKAGVKLSEFTAAHRSMQMRSESNRSDMLGQLHNARMELAAEVARAWQQRQKRAQLGMVRPLLSAQPRLAIADVKQDEVASDPESDSDSSSSSSSSNDVE